ncbi:MAG TPA: hypothetical protein VLA00_16340 [Xanthobacteraceae bacterium]|nr:hypothetical protein [Xanthobacteraceae bacterium]
MPEIVPFKLRLSGDIADQHQFQGYDGYMALAGFAWVLSLVSNFAETGKIRARGEFEGREAVRAKALQEGSVVAEFLVHLQNNPEQIFGLGTVGAISSGTLLYALFQRVVFRNLGEASPQTDQLLGKLLSRRSGDVEALVAISEAPIRQAHRIIGNGASKVEISGGFNILNTFDQATKDYVLTNARDDEPKSKDFSVAAFNANSGYGSVFDGDLGHVVPFSMSKEVLRRHKSVFSWGLDQYARGTGKKISAEYTRILALDGRVKRYIILSASGT